MDDLADGVDPEASVGFMPLYRQVRDTFVRRLVDGIWAPGDALPSEAQLAVELGVSQGTVRKALDALANENLVSRQQGRGTFVTRHDDEHVMFKFFKLVPDEGARTFPQSRLLDVERRPASAEERGALRLAKGQQVVGVRRLRSMGGRTTICETVAVPAKLFPEMQLMDLPNNLYGLYTLRFGITIARSEERLKAVAATVEEAGHLDVEPGAPLLEIVRVASSLERTPIEWRRSVCSTRDVHYLSELR